MKKFVSILLALCMLLCALPVTAETAALVPTFDLDIQTYQSMFDSAIMSSGLSSVWTSSEDGLTHICQVEGYPDMTVITASDGSIASISVAAELNLLNMTTMGNNFGEMMSYSSMSLLMMLDQQFLTDILTDASGFTNTLVNLLNNALTAAGSEPVSESVVIYGTELTMKVNSSGSSGFSLDLAFRMTPASQETAGQAEAAAQTAEPAADLTEDDAFFPYTLDDYRIYYDMLASSAAGSPPVWTVAEDGMSVTIETGDFPTVTAILNAEGQIVRYTCSIDATTSNSAERGNFFGQQVALVCLASAATEDETFITDADRVNQYTLEIQTLLTNLMSRIIDAMTAPVSESAEIEGDTVTFTLSIDLSTMTFTFGLIFEP